MPRLVELVGSLRVHGAQPDLRLRMLELAASTTDPLSRHQFAPGHFTASGFVLGPDLSSLLLVHHRRLDRWLQPGGHIDPGDATVEAAARREVIEETGVRLLAGPVRVVDLDVHPIPAGAAEPAHLHFDVRYLLHAADTMLAIDRDEVSDAAWFSLEDIVAGVGDRSVRRVARQLLATGV